LALGEAIVKQARHASLLKHQAYLMAKQAWHWEKLSSIKLGGASLLKQQAYLMAKQA